MALQKIGPYNFQGILGRGGMGTVYRGRHEETGEIHAIKVLAPVYANDPHFRGRFDSEIKALLKLDHPNIVQILSYGQDDGMLFFAMELVEGNSLFQMQRHSHSFDWREIISIAKDVAMGLRHAHDRGIIHRDLKPGNLLMTVDDGKQGMVKITDFGIAKRFGNSQDTGSNVLGTMDFMSPEQAKGELVTSRSDIYSLGTVLFTLLSGKPPFSSSSIEESLRNLTVVPAPRISTIVPGVPDELDLLIKTMMAKRPQDRTQTAQALLFQIAEVESLLRDESEAKTAHQPHPNEFSGDTFLVSHPQTKENTNIPAGSSVDPNAESTVDSDPTIAFTDHGLDLVKASSADVDYFENVTEKTRKSVEPFLSAPPPQKGGIVPVAMALLAVVLLAGYGIYRAFLPPSAEQLYAEIESGFARPQTVLEQIDLFLEHYPEDPRSSQVAELKETAEAIRFFNRLDGKLRARDSLAGDENLTVIEKQFLSIVELAKADPVQGSEKMNSFITLYENASQLKPRDRDCIQAAKGYQTKIKYDAQSKVDFSLKQLRSAMNSAESTTDPDQAIPVYRSIIDLFGSTDWGDSDESQEGRELVRKARSILKAMEAASKEMAPDGSGE